MPNFISIENLYYAKQTQDDKNGLVYTTPKPVGASVKISVDPTTSNADFYADGVLQEQATRVTSAKVAIEIATLPIETLADMLGHTLDGVGGIKHNKNDVAPFLALMYRREKINHKYRYIKIYKVKFTDPKDDGETVSNSIKIQDDTLDGTAFPLINNGDWKAAKDEEADGYTDVSTSWFQSVTGANDTTPPSVSTITPARAATAVNVSAPISIVFAESLQASTVTTDNIYLIKDSDGSIVATTIAYNDSNKTVTITPSSALSAASKYIVTVDADIKDLAGNNIAPYTSYFTTA